MRSLLIFIRESVNELRLVKWPTRQTTVQYSAVVLSSVVVFTAFLAGIDYLFSRLIDRVLG
ncbi:preprotein translocase subunit SecE [Candidatus Berkelbacteria bacterium]|nr:preprotein translocase subunit SecE [Candidatus Berkelbacteria bacterium]